jgi:tetratricopeptide (TPR) repeat protein
MPVVPQQVKALFLAAADKAPEDRAAFLEEACGSDAELRRRVEQLLGAHDEPGSQPLPPGQTSDEVAPHEPAEEVGTIVAGRYKLLQLLGEGGMGSVFMAEQTKPVKRMVALKVVKAGMDSKSVLGRFEAERQALALMDHPNIAKVLDAGATERAQPFFVMELVKGVPLTAFCDQRQLSIAERLEVFQAICQAVQHAHQKGIIHRDLKPSNILVESHDGRAVPKVIDFGLAKAINALPLTERSLFTQLGAMLGTPLYMAPEQAEFTGLDVDTRADIYALGVILYEVLTGTTPLEKQRLAKAAWDEIRRAIKEEEPPKPSTRLSTSEARASVAAQRHTDPQKLGKYVRGDLDWIVMKALAKERDRRYQTANAFAADIERFLNHEPVSAGPPTLRYQLRKFVRRKRAAVAVAATLAVLLLLGGIGLVVGLVAIRAEQQRTAAALAAETQARKQTRDALNAMTDDVIEKLFAKQPTLGENERAFLHKVLGFYQAFAADKGETEEARAVAAEGQFRVAKIRAFLGERREAVRGYREAIRLWEQLATDFPATPEYRHELARSHGNLGLLLVDLGQGVEAEAAYRRALGLWEKLATDFPAAPVYRHKLGNSHNNLANAFRRLGKYPEAEAAYRQAVALHEELAADFPAAAEYRHDLAGEHTNLGSLLMEQGKLSEAETAYRRALALHEQLAKDFPAEPIYRQHWAYSLHNLGVQLRRLGKQPEAEVAYRQALAIKEKVVADFPAVPAYRHELAKSHVVLGNLLADLGKWAEAEAAYHPALAVQEKLAAEFPGVPEYRQELANSHNCLALMLKDLGKRAEAEAAHRQALALQEKLATDFPAVPAYRQHLANSHYNLGLLLSRPGTRTEAEVACRQALALQEKLATDYPAVPAYRQDLARSHHNLGVLLDDRGKYPEAEAACRQALALQEGLAADFPTVPEYRQDLARSCMNVGVFLRRQKRPRDALEWFAKAISLLQTNLAHNAGTVADRLYLGDTHQRRALTLTDLHRYAEAIQDWDRAIELDEGPQRPAFRLRRAWVLAHAGDHARAVAEADDLTRADKAPGGTLYDAACVYGLSVPAAKDDAKRQEHYAGKALALLRRARDAGFFTSAAAVKHLQEDDDLAALRGHADFKQFVTELRQKTSPPAAPKP